MAGANDDDTRSCGGLRIVPRRLAHDGAVLRGALALDCFSRLLDEHRGAPAGEVSYALEFSLDGDGNVTVQGDVAVELVLECQRCLEPLALALAPKVCLAVLEEDTLMPADRDIDTMTALESVELIEFLETELLLALPFAPVHEPGACEPAAHDAGPVERTPSPFSVLRGHFER